MAPKGIRAAKIFERKSKAKVVEWKTREHSRGTRYVPVEIGTSTRQQIPGRDAVRVDIVNQEAILDDADPQPMDVDEPFWIDEDVTQQRRVSSPSCPFLMPFDLSLSPSVSTWKSLFLGLTPT
jgi:hypothetical protein